MNAEMCLCPWIKRSPEWRGGGWQFIRKLLMKPHVKYIIIIIINELLIDQMLSQKSVWIQRDAEDVLRDGPTKRLRPPQWRERAHSTQQGVSF